MKVLANDGISPSGKEKLEGAGVTVVTEFVAQDQLIDTINNEGYAGLLVRSATKVRKDLIDSCPGLKFVGRGGVGMDNIDVEYARRKGIEVFNTPAASSQSVAELVMGQLFSISRSLFDSERQMPMNGVSEFKALKKKYGKGTELRGKTLGIIGFGRIGRATATYALGCGMKVVAFDVVKNQEPVAVPVGGQYITVDVQMMDMAELLSVSDCISLHVPKQSDGTAVIGETELNKMKPGVLLVNAARGGVIDEPALISAIDRGQVRYAALDVFENEPTPSADIIQHAGIALTPHIGAATVEAQDRIGIELADIILSLR
jgi:D-3-phosphoglycerate dehydrogenase